ncbi:nucleotide exchange factor GrpE [Streptosporangium sp. NPDC003464]
MTDRRALLPLLLLACLAVTGCGQVAGTGGQPVGAVAPPSRADGGADGDGGRLPRTGDQRVGPGTAGTTGGLGPGGAWTVGGLGPLPLGLAAAGVLAATGAGLLLWRRSRRPGPAQGPWQGGPGLPEPPGSAFPPAGSTPSAPRAPVMPPAVPSSPVAAQAPAMPPAAPQTPAQTPGAVPSPPVAAQAPATGAHPPPGDPGASSGPPRAARAQSASDPLADALAEVAGSGISQALTQQVERLFAGGPPGRAALVEACIGCRDQIAERHPRLAGTLLDGLNRAGVREIVADGQRFDPRVHEAFGTEPTERPELHDVVAETVKRGYADGDRVIRVPQVAVYRHGPPGAGTAP